MKQKGYLFFFSQTKPVYEKLQGFYYMELLKKPY